MHKIFYELRNVVDRMRIDFSFCVLFSLETPNRQEEDSI